MRINLFTQIKGFYSWVFDNQDKGIKPHHHSLYMFLLNQNNRSNWIEWFKCPFDIGMIGSGINSKHTYYKTLKELHEWKLIQYKPGINNYKAPLIKIIEVQKCTSTVPVPEQLTAPQPAPQLGTNKDLSTLDSKQETENSFFENEIHENENPINFDAPAISEKAKKATKIISEFFNVSEINTSSFMKIGNFVKAIEAKGDIELLATQFTAYKKIKSKDPKFKHNWKTYLGDPEQGYDNGAWNEKNWSLEVQKEEAQTIRDTKDFNSIKKATLEKMNAHN